MMFWPIITWIQRASIEQFVDARGTTRAVERNSSILCCSVSGTSICPELVPERLSFALVGVIVEDDEVAHALHFERGCARL